MVEHIDESVGEITLSERAIAEITTVRKENSIPDEYRLRIGVKGGGCSGLTYSLGFDGEFHDSDELFEYRGIKLVVDAKSLFYLDGAEVDYADGPHSVGFVFNNPNVVRTCGGCSSAH